MKIITENPYRVLGVFSNSPTKERVASHNKLKAFLKVGKQVNFELDLPQFLPALSRTTESVAQADANLTLPADQIHFAQFWFMKITPLDDMAFKHLYAGNMDMARSIFAKKVCASSLQNLVVCSLITRNYQSAIAYAEQLYTNYASNLLSTVLGENPNVKTDTVAYDFLDQLCDEVGVNALMPYITLADWKNHLSEKSVNPIIDKIQSAIDAAKSVRKDGPTARYTAGVNLKSHAVPLLQQLQQYLPATDLQYQMIADKLGLEILQCGIDYFNGTDDDPEAAHKAMELQSLAQSIVVGQMAKDRCDENVDILQKIIAQQPPREVFAEDKAIKELLRRYNELPEEISSAVWLLNNAKPHLQAIKTKLGAYSSFYLKVSTLIVSAALHDVIEEVNEVQQEPTTDFQGLQVPISLIINRDNKIAEIKRTFEAAWRATIIMDTFDMEPDYKRNRYNRNRSTLKKMCEDLGISTYTDSVSSRPTSTSSTRQTPTSYPQQRRETTTNTPSLGCVCLIICTIVFIFSLIGVCS